MYYKLLKLNQWIKNPRLKIFGIYLLHLFNRRYLAVHFDPVNACNLRCKMCYFTDKDYVKTLKGIFPESELPLFASSILDRAVKLQIGCATEPTLYKNLEKVITLGKEHQVPFISMTTNANNLELDKLKKWAKAGLDEITVSLHGVFKETYEELMGKGDFNRFIESLGYITELKKEFPNFKLRVNYTFNEDNFEELKSFWSIFDDINIDVLQIRPIKKIGNTEYNNFSLENIMPKYAELYAQLNAECQKKHTLLLAPSMDQLKIRISNQSIVQNFTYCYISPTAFWKEGFDWKNENFNEFSSRTHWAKKMLKLVFSSKKELEKLKNESLNYEVV